MSGWNGSHGVLVMFLEPCRRPSDQTVRHETGAVFTSVEPQRDTNYLLVLLLLGALFCLVLLCKYFLVMISVVFVIVFITVSPLSALSLDVVSCLLAIKTCFYQLIKCFYFHLTLAILSSSVLSKNILIYKICC